MQELLFVLDGKRREIKCKIIEDNFELNFGKIC